MDFHEIPLIFQCQQFKVVVNSTGLMIENFHFNKPFEKMKKAIRILVTACFLLMAFCYVFAVPSDSKSLGTIEVSTLSVNTNENGNFRISALVKNKGEEFLRGDLIAQPKLWGEWQIIGTYSQKFSITPHSENAISIEFPASLNEVRLQVSISPHFAPDKIGQLEKWVQKSILKREVFRLIKGPVVINSFCPTNAMWQHR